MSDDENFSTRRVGADEMDRLRELLDKVEQVPEVTIRITPDLYARVDGVKPLCEFESDDEIEQFHEATRQIFEAGLREYEARIALDE